MYKVYKALIVAGIAKGVELDFLESWLDYFAKNNDTIEINTWKEIDGGEEVQYGT